MNQTRWQNSESIHSELLITLVSSPGKGHYTEIADQSPRSYPEIHHILDVVMLAQMEGILDENNVEMRGEINNMETKLTENNEISVAQVGALIKRGVAC